jgi:hypothetical protein
MTKQRRVGDVIKVSSGTDSLGRHFWFEEPVGFRGGPPPPGAVIHGPFATLAECEENQRLALFGPQSEVSYGGDWNPAWDRMQ